VAAALDASGCIELARLVRSGLTESRHLGAAAVVDARGSVLRALGDTTALIYPRSTLKPLQAIAVLRAGAPLEGAQIVLATASHAGSEEHLVVVRSILGRAGLTPEDLQCPVDWPLSREAANDLVRADKRPNRLHMNCSGKHAAFLLASVTNGWSTDDYLDPDSWAAAAPKHEGSWWPAWEGWLAQRSSGRAAPPPLGSPLRPHDRLAKAPGRYVHER